MAEVVEHRIEETIREVEELERIGILSSKEVKKLIQKRREHHYRLARRSKRKCDFVNYVNYEQNLIELIRIRRKQLGIKEKRQQIEIAIARRVLKYLRFLTRAWPSYLDTWAHRISFARFIGWKEEIASAFMEQVGFHGNKESVWVSWAKWEVEERQSFDTARNILLSKAAQYHPKSPIIKRELFRLELLYVESLLNKRKNNNIDGLEEVIAENREKVLKCAVPRAIYKNTVTTLPDPEVYLQLYQVADKFQFALTLCEEIFRDLCIKFPDAHCMWKLKAQRLASGIKQDDAEDNKQIIEFKEEIEEDEVIEEEECKEKMERWAVSLMKAAEANSSEDSSSEEDEDQEEEDTSDEESEDEETNAESNEADQSTVKDEVSETDNGKTLQKGEVKENTDSGSNGEASVENKNESCEDSKISTGEDIENKVEPVEIEVKVEPVQIESSSSMPNQSEKEDITIKAVSDNKVTLTRSTIQLDPMQKLKMVISTFDNAVSVVGATFVSTYVKELLPLLHQCWAVEAMASLVLTKLQHICQSHTPVLTPLHFYIWLQVLREQNAPNKRLRGVLDKAVRHHPDVASLKLEHIKLVTREAMSNAAILQEFEKQGKSLGGWCGLEAWREVTKRVTDEKIKLQIMEQAADHQDTIVSLGMRTHYLKHLALQEGLKGAREMYRKYSWRPPLCERLHAQMVELELSQAEVQVEAVRQVFHNATQQHGNKHPGVWLAYIQFEKHQGDPLKVGALYTRAETELEAAQAHVFRQLNHIIRDVPNMETTSEGLEETEDGSIFIDSPESGDVDVDDEWVGSRLVQLMGEEPFLTFTANRARCSFFSSITTMDKQLTKDGQKVVVKEDDGSEWEGVVKMLLGHQVPLSGTMLKADQLKQIEKHQLKEERSEKSMVAPRFKKRHTPTDCLDPGTEEKPVMKKREELAQDDVAQALKSSAVLQPEFMQKTKLDPLIVSKKKVKEQRKREQAKTKGPGWYDMKAPEITEEVKRDLEVLQMRSVIDPRRHFKASDMKVLPKYFQLGTVVDSPVEFYSSRVPKKQRKRTLADEIMNDEETLRYQKRKYTQIVAAKQKQIRGKTGRKGSKKGSAK